MNENLYRPQFNKMDPTGKQELMESLAVRYDMAFLGLRTFERWGQSCTTGVFEKDGREFAWSDSSSLTLHQSACMERTEDGFQTWIYHRTEYEDLLDQLKKQGLSLPTADEWAYLCGGGCRTLFPWGDGLDYSMRLHWFEDTEDGDRPYDMEEPNFFGLSIAYAPICGRWCRPMDSPPAAAGAVSAAVWGRSWGSFPARPTVSRKCRRTRNERDDA